MLEVRFDHTLKTFGRLGLGVLCSIAAQLPLVGTADEPPQLISPESFTQSVPPPPPPAPAATDSETPANSPSATEPTPQLQLPEGFDFSDPAMQPVDLHLAPLSQWNNLNQESPDLKVDPRYVDGIPIQPNQPPKNLINRSYHSDAMLSLEVEGEGGIENPYFAPVSPFCYYPLYFEEGCLERHGQSAGRVLQPLFSGLEFYTRIGLLPVKMIFEKPRQLQLTIWPEPVDPAWEYGF